MLLNLEYEPITLEPEDEGEVRVIGEFIEVIDLESLR
jgi:hypothetical protein